MPECTVLVEDLYEYPTSGCRNGVIVSAATKDRRNIIGRTGMRLGYTIIYVSDVAEAVEFYERAFGIEREFVHEAGVYAQMSTGETKLAFTSHALGATAVPVAYTPFDPGQPPAGVELTRITRMRERWQRSVVLVQRCLV
jgi:hypothetical protein